MSIATPQDVAARLGRELDTEETNLVQVRLDDAELILRNRIANLDDKDSDVVVMVESEMVLRLIRNPEGYVQEGDGGYTYRISDEVASGKLRVLNHEWNLLGIRGGLYSIAPFLQMPDYSPLPFSHGG